MDRPTAFIIINYITIIVTITVFFIVIFATIITAITMVVIVITSRDAFAVQRWIFLLGRQVQPYSAPSLQTT